MIALDRLQQIIPADQALANKALATALQQIAGINYLSLPGFAVTVSAVETNKDLPLINALTSAVPPAIADYWIDTFANGTGNDNTVLITDVLGTAAGWNETGPLVDTVSTFTTMDLSYLTLVYQTMLNTVNGVYDVVVPPVPPDPDPTTEVVIPSGLPGAGTYATRNDAVSTGLIPVAQTEITALIAAYPTQTAQLNVDWIEMANQLSTEFALQADANLVFADLTANQVSSIYGFIFNLPTYGLDTKVGGMAQFLEAIADLTTFTGQAIVSCLRQGRNQVVLNSAGILTNLNVPSDPNPIPPQAVLIPSEYTEAEATALVIK